MPYYYYILTIIIFEVTIMTKSTLKYFLIFTLLTCFATCSPVYTKAQFFLAPDIDKTLNNAYDSMVNIQNQLSVIVENYFISLVNQDNSTPSADSITAYSDHLNALNTQLAQYIDSDFNISQQAKLDILLNAIPPLKYMSDKIYSLLDSSDANTQYMLFRSIIYMDTLITQTLSYFNKI